MLKPDAQSASAYIEIETSHSYSIGYGPHPVAWLSGEAGWFQINPSERYKATYDAICDAITFYYHVMDIYADKAGYKGIKRRRKLFKKLDVNEVFYLVRPPAELVVHWGMG